MQFSTRLARYIDRWLDLTKTDKNLSRLIKSNAKESVYAKLWQGVEIVFTGKNSKGY